MWVFAPHIHSTHVQSEGDGRRSLSGLQRTAPAARGQVVRPPLRLHLYCEGMSPQLARLDLAGVRRQGLCDLHQPRALRANPPTPASAHLQHGLQHPERTAQAETCAQEMAAKATGHRACAYACAAVGSGVALRSAKGEDSPPSRSQSSQPREGGSSPPPGGSGFRTGTRTAPFARPDLPRPSYNRYHIAYAT